MVYVTAAASTVLTVLVIVWVIKRGSPDAPAGADQSEGITQMLRRGLPENYPRVVFTDVADEAGILFNHFPAARTTQLPEDMGSGAAWGDYDNDGDLDLYVVNITGPLTWTAEQIQASVGNALFRNDGHGRFSEIAKQAGVDHRGCDQGVAWGDYDGDDDLDLYVTAYGSNVLYRNNGDGSFDDVTHQAGVDDDRYSTGVAWGDYDRDGDLDLYVANYVAYRAGDDEDRAKMTNQYKTPVPFTLNPSSYPPLPNRLFRNNGNGRFTDVTAEAGVANETGRSLTVTFCDFNMDGWPDLYVANDVSANGMYQNLGNGRFADISASSWAADYRGAMGLAVGDFDRDEDMDIFLTHWIAQENGLYSNMRTEFADLDFDSLRFRDIADGVGLGEIALDYIGWGTDFFDYDNDGLLDLAVFNGSTFENPENTRELLPMKSMLFWNRGRQGYYNVASAAGESLNRAIVGRGAAFADYDDDGDVDVFVVVHGGRGMLLRNDSQGANHWLKVRTVGRPPNTRGVGARLRLAAGGAVQLREIDAGHSYLSQNSLEAEFGLGETSLVDSLVVTWPSGERQVLTELPVDQTVTVTQTGH